MAITNKWWKDRDKLYSMGIDTQYDITRYALRFQRIRNEEGDAMKRAATIQLDMHILESGDYTLQDLMNEFEIIRVHDPDYVNPGPTNRELQDPRIRRAWEEMNILRRLIK